VPVDDLPVDDLPVDDLTATDPFVGRLPFDIGAARLAPVDPGPIWQIGFWNRAGLARALKTAHALTLPGPGRTRARGPARLLWAGHRQYLLIGVDPDPALGDHAGLTDISDGWVAMRLTGRDWDRVLARLTPLDLRPAVFARGATARAELQHLQAQITRINDGVEILVMRSVAPWAADRIAAAMHSVAAQVTAAEVKRVGTASPA
jgi:sarcosine oxidase subunit gamma